MSARSRAMPNSRMFLTFVPIKQKWTKKKRNNLAAQDIPKTKQKKVFEDDDEKKILCVNLLKWNLIACMQMNYARASRLYNAIYIYFLVQFFFLYFCSSSDELCDLSEINQGFL